MASLISHWHYLADGFQTSSLDFYTAVEEALKAREVPNIAFHRVEFQESGIGSARRQYLRVMRGSTAFDICAAPYGKSFFFSWWLTRQQVLPPWLLLGIFLLGAPILFVVLFALARQSCLLTFLIAIGIPVGLLVLGILMREGRIPGEDEVLAVPFIGWLYETIFAPNTYYRLDTALMFQESLRRAVNDVIDDLLKGQGLRALSSDEQRPTVKALSG